MTRRLWTAQDQITAEVAAACGVSCRKIGLLLGRDISVIRFHLDPNIAEKSRVKNQLWRKFNYCSWYQLNRDKVIESARKWRLANPGKNRHFCREWRKANQQKELKRKRLYHNANRAKELQRCQRWREVNPEKKKQSSHKWRQSNLKKVQENSRRRNAWERAGRQRALLPVTQQQVEARRELWRHKCALCGVDAKHPRNHGRDRLTVEHVLALTKQGLDEASNIMPACTTCNSSKSNTSIEEWYRRQPFFTEARWRKIQRHCPAAVVGQLPLAFSPPDAEPAP